jgi:uncharacterized protein (TIGR02996 family)
MKRLELHAPDYHRYVEIDANRRYCEVRRAKIWQGKDSNNVRTALFPCAGRAHRQEEESVIQRFQKRGYREPTTAGAIGIQVEPPRNMELEAKIIANPNELDTRLVYADWLQQNNNPRGELIALMAESLKDPDNQALAHSITTYLHHHKDLLLGGIQEYQFSLDMAEKAAFTWHLGFLHSLYLNVLTKGIYHDLYDIRSALRSILTHASSILIHEIIFGMNGSSGVYYQPNIDCLIKYGPKTLRSLELARMDEKETFLSWVDLGDLSRLWTEFPGLSRVVLQGGKMHLGSVIYAEHIKHFEIRTGGLDVNNLRAIASSHWPELETLYLWLGDPNYNGKSTSDDLYPLLNNNHFPKLKRLGLMNANYTNEIVQSLSQSSLLPQLSELDLSLGTMDDNGAYRLLNHRSAFQHLSKISLVDNYLYQSQNRFHDWQEVEVGDQKEIQTNHQGKPLRYVTVGE